MSSNVTSFRAVGPQKPPHTEDEKFYMKCRAAYLAVFKSSLANITTKDQLCAVLQQAGRNPSQKTLNNYWTPSTTKLNFDDFCEILKEEKPTDESRLIKAFRRMDPNGSGHILHSELYRVLTSTGERMNPEEVNSIFSLSEINKDGKLDYMEFCRLLVYTAGQCEAQAVERLEADTRQRRQNFGNELESPLSHGGPPASEMPHKMEPSTTPKKGGADTRSPARPSSARSRRSSMSSAVTAGNGSTRTTKLVEPKSLQDWHLTRLKGCFYLEEDGAIVSLQYRLLLPQTTTVFLTVQPLNLSLADEKTSPWMTIDTALFLVTGNETKEDLNFVCCTELRDKEKFGWKGTLNAGTYYIMPFTTGCRLRKSRKPVTKTTQLVYRTDSGELALTKEFRATLSDIFEIIDLDGNGLLSLEEYNFFEQRSSGEKCDEDAWAVCKENFDTKKNELTRQGFMELNLMEANDREGDPSDLWVTLESMGYNRALEMVEACPFVINVYSEECTGTVQPVSLESCNKMLNTALCKFVITKGEAKAIKGHEHIVVHTYRSDSRVSSVISNKSNQKVTVHVNNDQSRNCVSSRGLTVFAVEVPPRTKVVCQHVVPANEKQEWTYNCTETVIS